MINQDSKILDYEKENKILIKNVNLGDELELFILIDSNDSNLAELILNKTLDLAIDNISREKTEKDLGIVLENINTLLKTWEQDKQEEQKDDVTIFIGALSKNKFYFSNIGRPSAYLIKKSNEVLEITEKEENKHDFNFISSGDLDCGDSIVISTSRLLSYLSYSDFNDSSIGKKADAINKNIETILEDEKVEENIGLISFKYNFVTPREQIESQNETKIDKAKEVLLKASDNTVVKHILGYYGFIKEFIGKQSSIIKNTLYISVVFGAILSLVFITDGIIGTTIETKSTEENKTILIEAKKYISKASSSSTTPENFALNIGKAEELISQLKEKNVFINDLEKLNSDISTIKKQFNQIENFEETEENLIYKTDSKDSVKVIKVNEKLYSITSKNVVGPILKNKTPKINAFSELGDDKFIDATDFGNSIILLTEQGKIVEFAKNGYFSYKDVKNQSTWEESETILSYGQNIYLISKDKKQILKHVKSGTNFNEGIGFLKEEDSETVGEIKDIAIDGGVYVLKNDLSVIKAFSSPYRIESIMINKLPDNYSIERESQPIKIKARGDLNYVYILLNNKIWVFKTNAKSYRDTKNLTYLGQIEGSAYRIKEFHVNHDGVIDVINENGIYEVKFNINDDKLLIVK